MRTNEHTPGTADKGYIHVYTGNGKGKTTAALGLALRSAGAGRKVFIGQFVKGMTYSEHHALALLKEWITIERFGRECFIYKEPTKEDIACAQQGLSRMADVLASGDYGLVVFDEATIALYYKLFTLADFMRVLALRPKGVDVAITGRYAPEPLILAADLVTEMKEIKHYYTKGVMAKVGIEK